LEWPAAGGRYVPVTAYPQAGASLDELFDLILTHLRAAELEGRLQSILERLCRVARAQDEAFPLALLAAWSYAAAGGRQGERALPLAAAWRCLHTAGKLLNDAVGHGSSSLLPGEPAQSVLNAGVGLIFLSQAILSQATANGIPNVVAQELQAAFARAGLRAAAAQQERLGREETLSWQDYRAVTAMRSGSPLALATHAGALLCWGEYLDQHSMKDTMPAYVENLTAYGHHLGMMLQLADDLHGIWRPDGRSDLALGRRTWPLLYGEMLASPEQRAHLLALAPHACEDPAMESALRELLVELDVPLAMVLAADEHRRHAEAALEPLADSRARRALIALVQRANLAPQDVPR
jgi:geranylgeranyl pyrophosphate synthase